MTVTVVVEPTESFPYEIRSFPAKRGPEGTDTATRKWIQAVLLGFHDGVGDDAALEKFVESEEKDGRILSGAYTQASPAGAWDPEFPVATYATHRKTLNVGAGKLLPAHLITAVTVRGTHRRRGLLRKLISTDLARARADGIAVAALTASEATIYGRFGFGPATHVRSLHVDTGPKFGFKRPHSGPAGIVEIADPARLQELEPELFARLHAVSFGSIGRQDAYRYLASGAWTYEHPEPDRSVRAAVHYGPDGTPDGYVSYKFTGWDAPATVAVRDLLAASDQAYLALWGYLGSIDLVQRVRWNRAPVQDPLEWALSDKRGYQVKSVEDSLWLRILDTAAALDGRHYWADGAITLRVTDPLGLAGGVFRLEVRDGQGTTTALDDGAPADLELGAAELASLYLSGVPAPTLAAAGTLEELSAGAAARFDTLFGTPMLPHSRTDF
ncbi:MAG: GNAT family N-acetyltransferase [Actinomycetota bacterium]|nr:GNAT family N-acetyltransferase [Actinomycetota bacterium]